MDSDTSKNPDKMRLNNLISSPRRINVWYDYNIYPVSAYLFICAFVCVAAPISPFSVPKLPDVPR